MGDEEQPKEQTQIFTRGGEPSLPPPYLVIVDGPHKGARFPLQTGTANTIGRLEECSVILDDQSVSRKHAELTLAEAGWTIKDLESKNGTVVNGARIEELVVLGHKDLLRFGIYTLRLVTQAIEPAEEMAVPEDVGEWGTVMVTEGASPEETHQLGLQKTGEMGSAKSEKAITAPHSPLEEEEEGLSWMARIWKGPKPRLWVLAAAGFVLTLGVGLYFYWTTILSPPEEKRLLAEPKVIPVERQPLAVVPLGPPEPEAPPTIPVFLDCVANPLPAVVYFQNKEIGKTPLKINVDLVPKQEYEIEARFNLPELQETFADRLTFRVEPDQSTLSLLFRAPAGTLKITQLPRDASLYVEAYFAYNRFQAKPVKLQEIVLNKPIYAPFGRYILELRQLRPMGETAQLIENIVYRREFVLEEDQPTFVIDVTEERLAQFPALIRSKPSGADVFIDQIRVGSTPYQGELPLGKHTLTLRKEGYFEVVQAIEAAINIPFQTEIELRTSAAGEKLNLARASLRQGVASNALQPLSEVFELNPGEGEIAEARYLLGQVYLSMGELDKAAGYFEQSGKYEKYKHWAKLGSAGVLAAKGETARALIPLVDVLLNAQEEEIQKEAQGLLREISPLRSVVYIQSDPPGAQVYLNDKKLAQATPILLHEMALGSYNIRLEKAGYQIVDLKINLSVNEFNPVVAKLKPLPD